MIGVGISLLSVYALGKYNDKVGDYNYSQECLIFFRNISWSNQSEIEVNSSKKQCWLIFLGSTFMVFAVLIGSAEAATYIGSWHGYIWRIQRWPIHRAIHFLFYNWVNLPYFSKETFKKNNHFVNYFWIYLLHWVHCAN